MKDFSYFFAALFVIFFVGFIMGVISIQIPLGQ